MRDGERTSRGFSKEGIRFRLGGIPVLVRWTHFILDAVLLWPVLVLLLSEPGAIVAVGPLFAMIPAAVLIHEVGHAVAARAFGGSPRIELVLFGGLTYPHLPAGTGPGRQAIVSLAGPFAGIAAGAAVWALTGGGIDGMELYATADLFVWAAAVWGGLNLVPLPGLDGGHVLDSSAELVAGARGLRAAAVVKVVTAVGVLAAVWAWAGLFGVLWIVIVLGRTGVDEIRRGWEAPRIERMRTAIDLSRRGRLNEAIAEARAVMDESSDRGLREVARQVLVEASAAAEEWERVVEHADSNVEAEAPHLTRALLVMGRPSEAEAVARAIEGTEGRLLLAESLVVQDLGHMVEIADRDEALALALYAQGLEARGRADAGRALARELAGRPEISADARAEAHLQLGEPLGATRDDLTPGGRWAAEVEAAGRSGDLEGLRALLRADLDGQAAARVQVRLHMASRFEAATEVGRRALQSVPAPAAPGVAYNLACSVARLGHVEEAKDLLERWLPGGLPEGALTDPDLASVRTILSEGPSLEATGPGES